jgi:hypothetical protein
LAVVEGQIASIHSINNNTRRDKSIMESLVQSVDASRVLPAFVSGLPLLEAGVISQAIAARLI